MLKLELAEVYVTLKMVIINHFRMEKTLLLSTGQTLMMPIVLKLHISMIKMLKDQSMMNAGLLIHGIILQLN